MKKLLLMLLMLSVLPFGLAYGENIEADGSAAETFDLSHVVARISVFTTKKLSSTINDGNNIIGKYEVKNNIILAMPFTQTKLRPITVQLL